MARQYSAKTFFRNVPNILLQQYFQSRHIDLDLEWVRLHETDVDPIFLALEQIPEGMRSAIDSDFRMINDLACEAGTLALLEEAAFWGRDRSEQFAGMKTAYERAFWTFLNEPARFRVAGNFHEMDRRGGWRRCFVGHRLETGTDEENLRALEKKLRFFYRRQGRGRFCHVDFYQRRNPERYCYFAYPEDYASTEVGFDDDGRFQHRTHRPAFENIFVYRPEEGVLELTARGNKAQIEQLQEIFCTAILGLVELPDDNGRMPYDLAVLKNRYFPFAADPKDRVAHVEVRQLRLDLPFDRLKGARRRITLTASSLPEASNALHRLVDEAINKENVGLGEALISQAKLRFTFAPVDGERPKTLTFEVTYPDRCTLKDDPHDQIAKKYLKEWGIARD